MVAPASTATALLSASFTHEYYGGDFTAFTAKPLPAPAAACQRLGLQLLRDGASLTLYLTPGALRGMKSADYRTTLAATTLCWQIVPRPVDFAACTAVDFTSGSQGLVFTSTVAGARGGPLTVSATASVQDVWPRQLLRFDFRPAKPLKAGATLRLETNAGTLVRSLKVTDPWLVAVDTSEFGSGLYQLAQGGQVLAKWFADERPFPPANTGAVLVLPGSLLAAAFASATSAGVSTPPVYTAAYAARSVIWRYHIFNTLPDDTLSIVPYSGEGLAAPAATPPVKPARSRKSGPTSREIFKPFTDDSLPDAKSFAAVLPLKLVQQPARCFALNNGSSSLYAPLPVAGTNFARAEGSTALCSDIFVYL